MVSKAADNSKRTRGNNLYLLQEDPFVCEEEQFRWSGIASMRTEQELLMGKIAIVNRHL